MTRLLIKRGSIIVAWVNSVKRQQRNIVERLD
jgi:hypothetical protein